MRTIQDLASSLYFCENTSTKRIQLVELLQRRLSVVQTILEHFQRLPAQISNSKSEIFTSDQVEAFKNNQIWQGFKKCSLNHNRVILHSLFTTNEWHKCKNVSGFFRLFIMCCITNGMSKMQLVIYHGHWRKLTNSYRWHLKGVIDFGDEKLHWG